MLNEIHIKGQTMDSDEEGNVDHLSPQTLLETPDIETQYSIRSPEGKLYEKYHLWKFKCIFQKFTNVYLCIKSVGMQYL